MACGGVNDVHMCRNFVTRVTAKKGAQNTLAPWPKRAAEIILVSAHPRNRIGCVGWNATVSPSMFDTLAGEKTAGQGRRVGRGVDGGVPPIPKDGPGARDSIQIGS